MDEVKEEKSESDGYVSGELESGFKHEHTERESEEHGQQCGGTRTGAGGVGDGLFEGTRRDWSGGEKVTK